MANPLFNQFGQPQQAPIMPNMFNIEQFKQFASTFNGDPRQAVQNLIQSGKMSQDQFNQYAQIANQLLGRR